MKYQIFAVPDKYNQSGVQMFLLGPAAMTKSGGDQHKTAIRRAVNLTDERQPRVLSNLWSEQRR